MSDKKLPPLTKDEYTAVNSLMLGMTEDLMRKFPDHPEFHDNGMLDFYLMGVKAKPSSKLFPDQARPEFVTHSARLWARDDKLIDDPTIKMFTLVDMASLYPRLTKQEKMDRWNRIHQIMRLMKIPGAPTPLPVPVSATSADVKIPITDLKKPSEPVDRDLTFQQTAAQAGSGLSGHPSMEALQQGAHALLRGREKDVKSAAAASSPSTSTEASVPNESQTSSAEQYIELMDALHTLMDNLEKEDAGETVEDAEDENGGEDDSDSDNENGKEAADAKAPTATAAPKKTKQQNEQAAMLVLFNLAFMDFINNMAESRGERFPVLKYCRDFFCLGLPIEGTTQRRPSYFSGTHLSRHEAFDALLTTFRKYPGFAGFVDLPKHMLEIAPVSEDAKKQGDLIDEKTGMALNHALGIKVGQTKSTTHISKRQKEQAALVSNREKFILEEMIPELKEIGAKEIYANMAKKDSNRDVVWKYVDKGYQILDKAEEVRNGDFKGFGKLANRILREIAASMASVKEEKDINPMQKMASVLTQAAKKLDRKKRRKQIRSLMTTFDDPEKANRAFELIGDIGGPSLADEMRREYTTAAAAETAKPTATDTQAK